MEFRKGRTGRRRAKAAPKRRQSGANGAHRSGETRHRPARGCDRIAVAGAYRARSAPIGFDDGAGGAASALINARRRRSAHR